MDEATLIVLGGWFAAILRGATPLLFVTLGETLSQRVGVINLGVEGEMLAGACFGFAVAATTGDPLLGLLAGGGAGLLLSSVHAGLCVGLGANQFGSGLAVWMIGLGITSFFGREFVGAQVQPASTLGGDWSAGIPFLSQLLDNLSWTAPLAIGTVALAGFALYRTRPGLAWRTVGEAPDAARAAGLSVPRIQTLGVLAGGFLAGIGGAVLSVDYTQTWAQEMTKGRGLVAVGLVIVARWNPWLVLPVVLVFGAAEAAVLRLQAGGLEVSSHLLATLPYVVALAVVVGAYAFGKRKGGMPEGLRLVFGKD
ncbi:MAG: ABC transporter permease [Minwuia sp.]|uniref:ABC transporter permease n=1 Tax=Minwuia sp. TaxID=2493630 RepID=UPI003A8A4286